MSDLNKREFIKYMAAGLAVVSPGSSLLAAAPGSDKMPESKETLADGEKV